MFWKYRVRSFPENYLLLYAKVRKPHLDYGNIIYEHCHDSSFYERLESIQYASAGAIAETIKGYI